MTHDMHLQAQEVKIVEEPITIARNFVPFVFFVPKSSTRKRFNSAFGVQATSLPRAEADSGRAITVRNEEGGGAARLRYGTKRGSDRQYCGAERNVVLIGNIAVRNETWISAE